MRGFNSASINTIARFAKNNDDGISEETQNYLNDIKATFKEVTGRSLKLTDKALAYILDKAGEKRLEKMEADETEGEGNAMIQFLIKNEEQAKQVAVADPGITTLVSKLDKDFETELEACIDAVVKNKTTALDMLAQFYRVWTMEEMDGAPMPGTDKDTIYGNYRPDKVVTVTNTGQEIKTVWTNDLVSSMPKGKELESIIDDVAKEVKTAGSVPRFKGKSAKELESIKKSATQKRNAIRSMVKRALAFHHQARMVEGMPKVGWKFLKPQHGDKVIHFPSKEQMGMGLDHDEIVSKGQKVSSAPAPIYIWPADAPEDGRIFSVTQFLNFDVPEALANGGTMADLVKTGGRGSGEGEEGTGDGSDWDVDTIEGTTSQLVNALNKRETMALVLKKIASKKGEGNDLLDNLCTLYLNLKPIYDKNKTAFENLQKREDAEAA